MKAQIKRVILLVVGWAFILLGIVGLFLPVLQGILFLLIGLFILSSENVWAHRLLCQLKQRFPHIAEQFEHARQRSEKWVASRFHKKPPVKAKTPETEAES
jgi:uncharacterized protein